MTALRRYLILGEVTEKAYYPDWYPLLVASDLLHAPPWEVLKQSVWWQDKAHVKNTAESQAREYLSNRKGG